jgi:hypothetical protein
VTGGYAAASRASWNRQIDLASDEALAQVLDRGTMAEWRKIYRLAQGDAMLRSRLAALVARVPLPLPHFWLAALASLGEDVYWGMAVPDYYSETTA